MDQPQVLRDAVAEGELAGRVGVDVIDVGDRGLFPAIIRAVRRRIRPGRRVMDQLNSIGPQGLTDPHPPLRTVQGYDRDGRRRNRRRGPHQKPVGARRRREENDHG